MKPIIVDMKEMSDSREVYESRPHPFFVWFIYLLLAMAAVAVIWAACFKIDIVVTGKGTVAAIGESSTVTNTKAGIITKCNIEDGQTVKKGDVLYEVEHEELELQLTGYQEQEKENTQRLEMMKAYLDWLSDNTVNLSVYKENPFYTEYAARSRLVALNMESVKQEYSSELNANDARLTASENLVSYYEQEINRLNQLSDAVRNRINPFQGEEAYYYAKANDYLTQYHNTEAQYDMSISGLQQELDNAFNQISEIKRAAGEAGGVGEETDGMAQEPNTQIKSLEAAAREKQQAITTAQAQKQTALSNLETETIASIESTILTYQQNLINARGTQTEIESVIDNTKETGTNGSIENVMQTEIQAVTSEISACQANQEELQTTLAGLEKNMKDMAVNAPISGTVNLVEELVEGNYLAAGTAVLTIIPQQENDYMVKAYIDNQDIAKISEDMAVKYKIAAYPSSEYGTLTGEVSFVSSDLKASGDNGSAYYMVETSIDDTNLLNEDGEKVQLKVGMLCETKIIVEQKSVLRCLLEKIKLLD